MARRVLFVLGTVLVASVVVFAMVHVIPGDPAVLLAGPRATEEDVVRLRGQMRLDQPFFTQWFTFLWSAVGGDLGRSLVTREAVAAVLGRHLRPTLELGVSAISLAVFIGIPLGVLSAIRHQSWLVDKTSMIVAVVGLSVPPFWLGLMLLMLFSVKLRWFPLFGSGSLRHLVLPAMTLGGYQVALVARVTRSSLLEVLRKDYVKTARAKGLAERTVIWRHALKNALMPVVSLLGLQLGWVVGGAVVVEMVFSRPGLGWVLLQAVLWRDYPLVQGCLLMLVLSVAVMNVMIDVLYVFLDPRIRYGAKP